jgi:hypothetical protein
MKIACSPTSMRRKKRRSYILSSSTSKVEALNGAGNPDDGTGLVNAGEKDIVVVTFNYRVGVLGFLASKEVKLNGDLNAGNLDQRFLLKWIQEHISKVSLFLYLLNYS